MNYQQAARQLFDHELLVGLHLFAMHLFLAELKNNSFPHALGRDTLYYKESTSLHSASQTNNSQSLVFLLLLNFPSPTTLWKLLLFL